MNENEAEFYLEKLFQYFKVSNMSELAHKIGVTQKAVSNWKTRNSVSAIKKKCRELGIYNEIFGDIAVSENTHVNIKNDSCKKISLSQMDKTIVGLFLEVYEKLEKENNLKQLFDVLGELKYKKEKQ